MSVRKSNFISWYACFNTCRTAGRQANGLSGGSAACMRAASSGVGKAAQHAVVTRTVARCLNSCPTIDPLLCRREWAEQHGLPQFASAEYDAALDAVCSRSVVRLGFKHR